MSYNPEEREVCRKLCHQREHMRRCLKYMKRGFYPEAEGELRNALCMVEGSINEEMKRFRKSDAEVGK